MRNGDTYAIAALKRRRAALAGELASLKNQMDGKREHLIHVDATLALLDPTYDAAHIRPRKAYAKITLFRKGELARTVRDALRRAGKPTMTANVVSATVALLGADASAIPAMSYRVRASLLYLERGKEVVRTGSGRETVWALTSPSGEVACHRG